MSGPSGHKHSCISSALTLFFLGGGNSGPSRRNHSSLSPTPSCFSPRHHSWMSTLLWRQLRRSKTEGRRRRLTCSHQGMMIAAMRAPGKDPPVLSCMYKGGAVHVVCHSWDLQLSTIACAFSLTPCKFTIQSFSCGMSARQREVSSPLRWNRAFPSSLLFFFLARFSNATFASTSHGWWSCTLHAPLRCFMC